MPRAQIILTNECPYHITSRSNNQEWYDLPIRDCFTAYEQVLSKTIEKYQIQLHAFVLMNNHLHMMMSTPHLNISAAMRYFMTETSRALRIKSLRTNHIYGGRYKWSVIRSAEYYANCLKYVYRNPVEAGLCLRIQDYLWSTASSTRNNLKAMILPPQFGHDHILSADNEKNFEWFNENFNPEVKFAIQKGLRRSVFKPPLNRRNRKPVNFYLPHIVDTAQDQKVVGTF